MFSDALKSINVNALISIGGDDTLKTANKFKRFQELKTDVCIPIVHLPKTIDNDYHGIDFTFGFFTAVEFLASEIRNLIYDAEVTKTYFIAETMGRSAGWLSYGAAIAGEASLVISVEDIIDDYLKEESHTNDAGELVTRNVMNIERVVNRIVKTMLAREEGRQGVWRDCAGRRTHGILALRLHQGHCPRRSRAHLHFTSQSLPDLYRTGEAGL